MSVHDIKGLDVLGDVDGIEAFDNVEDVEDLGSIKKSAQEELKSIQELTLLG